MAYDITLAGVSEWQDISDPAIWTQHLGMVQERANTIATNVNDPQIIAAASSSLTAVAAGTDIQLSAWWSGMDIVVPGFPPPSPWYLGMQSAISRMLARNFFIDHRTTFEGLTPALMGDYSSLWWTMDTLRTAASLPPCYQLPPLIYAIPPIVGGPPDPGYSVPDLSQLPANSCWRRKRPREVDESVVSGYDLESNAWIYNQEAWHQYGVGTWLCRYDGTDWAAQTITAAGPLVDVLDNTLAAPNCITLDVRGAVIFGAFGLGAQAGYSSMCNSGDYVGWWLFEEVRQIANLMRWQIMQAGSTAVSYFASVTSTISYADALAKMAAAWAPGEPAGVGFVGAGSGAYIFAQYDGTTWFVTGQRWSTQYSADPLAAVAKEIDLYAYAELPVDGYHFVDAASPIFDKQSDDVIQNKYHLVESVTTSATTYTFAKFGDETTPPPNAPPGPAPGSPTMAGYEIKDAIAVLKFDCTGGYTYKF